MASRNTAAASGNLPQTPPQLKIQTQPAVRSPPAGFVPQYPTAEQEKAALRRYEEAKRAVDRTQGGDGAPVAYDALYPEGGSSSQQQQQPREADLPPPFQESTSGIPAAHLSEKERMRREYEARDAAALLGRSDSANAPSVNGYSYPGGYVRYSESVPGYTSPSPPPMIDEAHLPPPFQPGAGLRSPSMRMLWLRRRH
ncbi:hypothetical protein BDQ17DRAFT_616286 [Cyathus striatus]|nr:hypothetical protein BDQ17DRAFT_616286 [Cyathus striatus]